MRREKGVNQGGHQGMRRVSGTEKVVKMSNTVFLITFSIKMLAT